jgi:TRAP-type mannitol/chloroaromatic compound transport system permease large subunit
MWMLLTLAALIMSTGLPVWALLIGVASVFAAVGVMAGAVDAHLLSAVPIRIVGLLEHDLLQALPLYVFFGMLLQRVRLADAIFSTLARALHFSGAGVPLAALGTGVLIAPMNGSVASSSALLARLVAPRLQHLPAAPATALIAASATIGVVVPPSLVLILLGDAMLRAHTEASNLPGFQLNGQRIISTQDVFNAALLPAAGVLLMWCALAWWQGHSATEKYKEKQPVAQLNRAQAAITFIAILAIVGLLASVFWGWMFAVEAAATGGCLLTAATLCTRSLDASAWRGVLHDTVALTGALFALLVGATTFSLVFRAFGTDQWLSGVMLSSQLSSTHLALVILLGVMACAWALDAFEIIFVVIPLIAPTLIAKLGDAQQAAVLLLLVLQLSFLLPPLGYAVLMARARSGFAVTPTAAIFKAIWPYALIVWAQAAIVFIAPSVVHQLDATQKVVHESSTPSENEVVKMMEDMARQKGVDSSADAPLDAASVKNKN